MKKWIESDLITKTINDYNDNMEEIEQNLTKPLVLENLIENGNFSDGMSGWLITSLKTRESSDFLELLHDGSNAIVPRVLQKIKEPQNNDYIYTYGKFIVSPSTLSLGIVIRDWNTGGTFLKRVNVPTNKPNELQIISDVVFIDTPFKGLLNYYIQPNSSSVDDLSIAKIKDILMINLTQVFGAGNEPTKEEMDEIINITGWFDNEYALSNKEMFTALLNTIRKNTMAITALGGTQ